MGDIHAFSWTPATGMVDIGTLGGETRATDVNDHGVVAGFSYWRSSHLEHAFRWTQAGGLVDLPGLGGPDTAPYDVNERGEIVGYSSTGAFPYYVRHPVLWKADNTLVQSRTSAAGKAPRTASTRAVRSSVPPRPSAATGVRLPGRRAAASRSSARWEATPRARGRSTTRARSPATARRPAPEPTRTRRCGQARRPLRSRSRPSPVTAAPRSASRLRSSARRSRTTP